MKAIIVLVCLVAAPAGLQPATAQPFDFDQENLEEALKAARQENKFALVYLFGGEAGGFETLDHLWRDPDIARFLTDKAVRLALDLDTEAGRAFAGSHQREDSTGLVVPALYFLSQRGEVLGTLAGPQRSREAAAHVLVMIGHAECANRALMENHHGC